MSKELIKPTYLKNPDFISGEKDNSTSYDFNCLSCGEKLQLNYKTQIENSWTGKGQNLSDQEYIKLKKYYKIGIVNKSKEGGFPVFDKIYCHKCKTEYFTYIGIDEPRNAVYHIQVQGIMKND